MARISDYGVKATLEPTDIIPIVDNTDPQNKVTKKVDGTAISTFTEIYDNTTSGLTATTKSEALDELQSMVTSLLPPQTGNSGKFLTTDGTVTSWEDVQSSSGTTTVEPTISINSSVNENSHTQGTISNYDSEATYTITATNGTIDYTSGDTFTYTAPDVTDGDDDVDTISIYATKSGELKSNTNTTDITVAYVPTAADTTIQVTDIYNDLGVNDLFEEVI